MNLYFVTSGNDDQETGDLIVAESVGKAKALYQAAVAHPVEFTATRCQHLVSGVDRPAGPLDMGDTLYAEWFEDHDPEVLP